jgi:S1-C subfamily serine protease
MGGVPGGISRINVVAVLLLLIYQPLSAQNRPDATAIAAAAQAATVQIRSVDADGRRLGAGTGFLVSADGMIVTNFHVIQRAHSLEIELPNGDEYAEIYYVAGDPHHDIAILKISADGLAMLPLNGGSDAVVGQRIYTMGHPLGQTATFSDGLVSALRTVEAVTLIQITAPLSPGSSGGPVMNDEGEVIGIATMMMRGGQNLNFAVPSRHVQPLLDSSEGMRLFAAALLPEGRSGVAVIGSSSAPDRAPPGSARRGGAADSRASAAADPWEAQVLRQIDQLEAMLVAEGATSGSRAVETGALGVGESTEITVRLEAGAAYALLGVCDVDCSDIDLGLYAPDGTLIDDDVRDSDLPYVVYVAATSGSYRIRVTMAHCDVAPCRYGVATFVLEGSERQARSARASRGR